MNLHGWRGGEGRRWGAGPMARTTHSPLGLPPSADPLRLTIVAVIAAALLCSIPPAFAEQQEVVFVGFGGSHEKNMRERVLPPFERRSGVKVLYVPGTTASNFARVQSQRARPDADVLWNNDLVHVAGKSMGLFDKLDPRQVPNLAQIYDVARDPDGIGVMQGFQAHGLEYIFGPINRQTRLEPAVAAKVPYGAEHVARMVKLDFRAIHELLPVWTDRWNKEIERR
jgi:hypothetical protein